jgi:histone deacetylase HOS3
LRAIRAFLARLVRFQRPKLPSRRQGNTLRNRGADPYTAAITLEFPDFVLSNLRLDYTRFVQTEEPRSASADILSHPAVKYVHGNIGGDLYLENLSAGRRSPGKKLPKGKLRSLQISHKETFIVE